MRTVLPTEPDRPPVAKLLLVLAGTMAIFGLAIFWAARLVILHDGSLRPASPDAAHSSMGKAEIGIVDQTPYGAVLSEQTNRAVQRERLSKWEWIDREHGVVQMPIEEAMRRIENGERP